MRLLYCRSNRLLRMSHKPKMKEVCVLCSQNVFIELCRSFYTTFHCPYFLTQHTKATFSKLRVACNNVYCKILFWSQATKQCHRNVCVQYHVSNISSKHFEVNWGSTIVVILCVVDVGIILMIVFLSIN